MIYESYKKLFIKTIFDKVYNEITFNKIKITYLNLVSIK